MRLKRIKIQNILGIESFEADVSGRYIQILGDNGVGKSSFIKALEGALGSGNRADLIRMGAKAGESVLVFDNDYELVAKFGPNGTNRKCKTPEGATITAVQAWHRALRTVHHRRWRATWTREPTVGQRADVDSDDREPSGFGRAVPRALLRDRSPGFG